MARAGPIKTYTNALKAKDRLIQKQLQKAGQQLAKANQNLQKGQPGQAGDKQGQAAKELANALKAMNAALKNNNQPPSEPGQPSMALAKGDDPGDGKDGDGMGKDGKDGKGKDGKGKDGKGKDGEQAQECCSLPSIGTGKNRRVLPMMEQSSRGEFVGKALLVECMFFVVRPDVQ